jgi:hypothetical protein
VLDYVPVIDIKKRVAQVPPSQWLAVSPHHTGIIEHDLKRSGFNTMVRNNILINKVATAISILAWFMCVMSA